MSSEIDINQRAGLIADIATGYLVQENISRDLVTVTAGATPWPLAVRTSDASGFGKQSDRSCYLYLEQQAALQARYAQTVGGRSASDQEAKLAKLHRTPVSYGIGFSRGLRANFAHDHQTGLTLTVQAADAPVEKLIQISETAVTQANEIQPHLVHQTAASRLVNSCLRKILPDLPDQRSAVAMIALPPEFHRSVAQNPAIICSQIAGTVTDPSVFSIVQAKALSTIATGKPSGPEALDCLSRIPGAVPMSLAEIGQRVIAAGGLLDGYADVAAIKAAVESLSTELQISLLLELTT